MISRSILCALVLLGLTRQAEAQASDCTYDRCALRLHSGLFGTRLVEGKKAVPVAKFGIFTPHIPLLERSTDSVRVHFAAFRSQQAKGSVLALASLAVAATGFFLAIGKNNSKNLGTGLAIGGLALTFGSGIALRHAGNQLAQAVWWYNRPLRQP